MSIKNPDNSTRFYEALRNAQPLGLLASLSIVIATFSHANPDIPMVYSNAVLAAIMFLISFIVSLIDQLFPEKESSIHMVRWGKFFFLAIGIFYLALVAIEFSKSLHQVIYVIASWGIISIGISFLIPVITQKGKFDPHIYDNPSTFNIIKFLGVIYPMGFIGAGVIFLGKAFVKYKIDNNTLTNLEIIILGISSFILFIEFALMIHEDNKRRKKLE